MLVACGALLLAPAHAPAQSPPIPERPIVLTDSLWSKFVRATERLYTLDADTIRDDATAAALPDTEAVFTGPPRTAPAMAAQLRGLPPVARAIASAGLTPLQYAQVQMAIVSATPAMAPAAGAVDPIDRANAEFLRRHMADLRRLQRLEEARRAKVPSP